jgi:hypothetical protein
MIVLVMMERVVEFPEIIDLAAHIAGAQTRLWSAIHNMSARIVRIWQGHERCSG